MKSKSILVDITKCIVLGVSSVRLPVKLKMDRNALNLLFVSRNETYLYWFEVLLGLIVPFILLNIKKIRMSRAGLFYSALFVVLGFILNRMNVSITGMEAGSGASYLSSWMKVFIIMAIVSLGFVTFTMIGRYFPVFSEVHSAKKKNHKINEYEVIADSLSKKEA